MKFILFVVLWREGLGISTLKIAEYTNQNACVSAANYLHKHFDETQLYSITACMVVR